MKVLGRGWQYTTYDIGNNRVLKKGHSGLLTLLIILRDCFPYLRHPVWTIPREFFNCRKSTRDSITKISNNSLEPWMLGNPRILSSDTYEQDKVTPLARYFRNVSVEDGENIIDAFVAFNTNLIRNSIIDKNFDIANNFGLDSAERIILMDLGELYTAAEEIDAQIQKRIWRAPYVMNCLPTELRPYFVEKMDEAFAPKPEPITQEQEEVTLEHPVVLPLPGFDD